MLAIRAESEPDHEACFGMLFYFHTVHYYYNLVVLDSHVRQVPAIRAEGDLVPHPFIPFSLLAVYHDKPLISIIRDIGEPLTVRAKGHGMSIPAGKHLPLD